VPSRKTVKIGRPGYKVTKQWDGETGARSLVFALEFPEVEPGLQPRHRFMSAFEQRVEAVDKNYQYLLFACDPYETIAFKIPNKEIDKGEGRFFTEWDSNRKIFTVRKNG
jgi:splicing factor 3A subunit 2